MLAEVLQRLEPIQQDAVALVYFEGRSPSDAARVLTVETGVVAAALSAAFGRISRWVMDEDEGTSFGPTTVGVRYGRAEARPGAMIRDH